MIETRFLLKLIIFDIDDDYSQWEQEYVSSSRDYLPLNHMTDEMSNSNFHPFSSQIHFTQQINTTKTMTMLTSWQIALNSMRNSTLSCNPRFQQHRYPSKLGFFVDFPSGNQFLQTSSRMQLKDKEMFLTDVKAWSSFSQLEHLLSFIDSLFILIPSSQNSSCQ